MKKGDKIIYKPNKFKIYKNLTINKIYTLLDISDYQIVGVYPNYCFIDDKGYLISVPKSQFQGVKDTRKQKLQKIMRK